MGYKILVIGGGGREHAIINKIVESPQCEVCFALPGNPGIGTIATNLEIPIFDFDKILDAIKVHKIELVIVGPEVPLVDGIVDFLKEELPSLMVVGPKKYAAQLEGSKAFAKEFMMRHQIPTAAYIEVTKENLQVGIDHIHQNEGPYVLKADGLASGKGVLIIEDAKTAEMELKTMLDGKFGDASLKVVIEQFLDGIEFSVFALTDGKDYIILPEAKDYKRIGEGDTGLNTGGMGAISPVPFFDEVLRDKVIERIIDPTIKGFEKDNIDFNGFVFFGLIKVGDEPFVIEYNCRMGDPETEAVFPRIKSDVVEAFLSLSQGKLKDYKLIIDDKAAATIILVSSGYPEDFKKGFPIKGTQDIDDSIVFHSGTSTNSDGEIVTNGGRVIAITTLHENWKNALTISKQNAEKIDFKGKYYRKDIGFDL